MNQQPFFSDSLLTDSSEYFLHGETNHCLNNGSVVKIEAIPVAFASLITKAIEADPRIERALLQMEITDANQQVEKYYDCNYSAYDHQPDITATGELGPREYVRCPNRGTCKQEGILCQIPFGLTRRERDVIQQIGLGKLDKEICDILNISQDTLRNHKDHISQKTGEERKPALGIIAHKSGLM